MLLSTLILPDNTTKSNWRRQDFAEKNKILNSKYCRLSPLDFLTILFHDQQDIELPCILSSEKKHVVTYGLDQLIQIASFRNDIYTAPATFFNNYRKTALLKTMHAICLDLDDITASSLPFVLHKVEMLAVKPTLILNSGGGLHLYWVFNEPLECFNNRKPLLKDIVKKLYDKMQGCCKFQKLGIIQSFRVCGSLTKLGDITVGYQVSKLCKLEDLQSMLYGKSIAGKKINITNNPPANVEFLPNGSNKFYQHCFNRMAEVGVGNREFALFALAIVAYKCRIPKEHVSKDLDVIANFYHGRDQSLARSEWFNINEVKKAIKGYSKKYLRVTSQQLEQWFGFDFPRKTKRNGRTQTEHLKRCRIVKNAIQKKEKKSVIGNYLKNNPKATIRQIITATGFSSTTICKYIKELRS